MTDGPSYGLLPIRMIPEPSAAYANLDEALRRSYQDRLIPLQRHIEAAIRRSLVGLDGPHPAPDLLERLSGSPIKPSRVETVRCGLCGFRRSTPDARGRYILHRCRRR